MIKILAGVGIIAVLVFVFILTFLLNKRTPKPEGCQNLDEECSGCQMLSCSHHPKNNETNEKNNEKGESK